MIYESIGSIGLALWPMGSEKIQLIGLWGMGYWRVMGYFCGTSMVLLDSYGV
jgi:hypothetical protein